MATGLAKTASFMLGTASVLVGPQAKLFDLDPTTHGLGLVKNFKVSAEPSYTELTQGVKNTIVFSVLTKNTVRASMEVFEYTSKNLSYGLGLDGSAVAATTVSSTTSGSLTGGSGIGTTTPLAVASGTSFSAGDFIMIFYGSDDNILIRKIASKATNNLTLSADIPTGITVPSGSVVKKVTMIGVGSKVEQPFLSAMAIGTLASGEEVMIGFPKVRVTKGFDIDFRTDNYGNLPFEFTVYDQVSTDPFYADFGGDQARVFTRS